MEYRTSDSSGTDDDLPPSYPNRSARGGHVSGNRRTIVGVSLYPVGTPNGLDVQIHQIEKEAYTSVLRAFKAQSDTITWEKEGLITELRKELRISDDEHKDALIIVNADERIRRMREWRQLNRHQGGVPNNAISLHDAVPSPITSRKRQKTSLSVPSVPVQSQTYLPHQLTTSMQPSSSVTKKGVPSASKANKQNPGQKLRGAHSSKHLQYSSAGPSGREQLTTKTSSALASLGPAETHNRTLIGRKIKTRWPDDNSFYEAVIADYNPAEGNHLLIYDMNKPNESREWVNLNEIPADDIRWEGEDAGLNQRGTDTSSQLLKKSGARAGSAPVTVKGKGASKTTRKKCAPSQNGIGSKNVNEIEILHTDSLIKEVEKVFLASHPDPVEIERAREVLKEHEQSLIDAIARLGDASDGESDENMHQPLEFDRGWQGQQLQVVRPGAYYEGHMGARRGYGDGIPSD